MKNIIGFLFFGSSFVGCASISERNPAQYDIGSAKAVVSPAFTEGVKIEEREFITTEVPQAGKPSECLRSSMVDYKPFFTSYMNYNVTAKKYLVEVQYLKGADGKINAVKESVTNFSTPEYTYSKKLKIAEVQTVAADDELTYPEEIARAKGACTHLRQNFMILNNIKE